MKQRFWYSRLQICKECNLREYRGKPVLFSSIQRGGNDQIIYPCSKEKERIKVKKKDRSHVGLFHITLFSTAFCDVKGRSDGKRSQARHTRRGRRPKMSKKLKLFCLEWRRERENIIFGTILVTNF